MSFQAQMQKAEQNLTLFLKEVSEVADSESENCNDDGGETERLCEPDSAGVRLYVWWALITCSDGWHLFCSVILFWVTSTVDP